MKFIPKLMHSIRGTRYYYKVIKKVKGMPGFAPEFSILEVCDIVVKFLDGEQPYMQFSDNCPNVITIDDLEEIIKVAKKGFIENDFPKEEDED